MKVTIELEISEKEYVDVTSPWDAGNIAYNILIGQADLPNTPIKITCEWAKLEIKIDDITRTLLWTLNSETTKHK
jgi:hypothetical protein